MSALGSEYSIRTTCTAVVVHIVSTHLFSMHGSNQLDKMVGWHLTVVLALLKFKLSLLS